MALNEATPLMTQYDATPNTNQPHASTLTNAQGEKSAYHHSSNVLDYGMNMHYNPTVCADQGV